MAGILSRTGARLLSRPALNALAQRSPVLDSLRSAKASPSTRSFASGLPPSAPAPPLPPPLLLMLCGMLLGLGARTHDLMGASLDDRLADAHGGGGVTYAGLTLHKPARWHVLWGTGMSALMWCVPNCCLLRDALQAIIRQAFHVAMAF